MLGALVTCAAGYAEGGRLARHMPGWQVIAWAVVAALPATALTCALALPSEPVRWAFHGLAGLAYLAAVSQFGGFIAWYRGLAALGVPRASQLQLAQPLLTLAWSALILGERLSVAAPVAAAAVIACIAVTQRAHGATARRNRGPLRSDPGAGPDSGWRARMPLIRLRQHPAVIAQSDHDRGVARQVRATLRPFRR